MGQMPPPPQKKNHVYMHIYKVCGTVSTELFVKCPYKKW